MQITQHESGLAVAWNHADKKTIDRELRSLDPDLFLDAEIDPATRRMYWIVCQHLGSAVRPHRVLVWRDEDGTPRPLSHAIVDEVKRRERRQDADRLVREAVRENDELRARLTAQSEAAKAEVEQEHRARIRAAELDSLPPYWRPRRFGAGG